MQASYRSISAIFAFLISGGPSAAWAADPIVGTLQPLPWSEEETESKAVHKNFGDHPSGLTTFTPDGRMTMVAYAGGYKTDGDKLTRYPEVSWNQVWNGT